MTKLYPAFLNLANKPVVVIGGGAIAERKIESLLACGAEIHVVAPELTPGLAAMAAAGNIAAFRRAYETGDCDGSFLVVAATDNRELQVQVWTDAHRAGAIVNTVDEPALCDFIVPAVVDRGDVTIAVSTAGKSPSLAAKLRDDIAAIVGPEYGDLADILGRVRPEIQERFHDYEIRKTLYRRILDSGVLSVLRQGDRATAERDIRTMIESFEVEGMNVR